jgi:peptide/nickel transport system permease protein
MLNADCLIDTLSFSKSMTRYLMRRLGHALLLLWGVSTLLFVLLQAAPGEFFSDMRLNPQISAETVAGLRAQYGLDQPLPVRYFRWIGSVARGEFGYSFAYNIPVSTLLAPRIRNTLLLTVPALVISWLVAVPVGVLAAYRKGSWIDRVFSAGTSTLLALPDLFIALLVLLFALRTGIFPVGGMSSTNPAQGWWKNTLDIAWHMVLPVAALVVGLLPTLLRHTRASMVEVLDSSFMRAAHGHGLSRKSLLFRYALPAAANPLISLFGLSIAGLLSVSLLVEVIVGWPGIGPLLIEAILSRDLFVVIAAVLGSTLFLVIGNLVADILLYAFDPRIRVQ